MDYKSKRNALQKKIQIYDHILKALQRHHKFGRNSTILGLYHQGIDREPYKNYENGLQKQAYFYVLSHKAYPKS